MLVQDVMQQPVVTTTATATLSEAYTQMREHDIRHLPVMEDETLAGILTDRDIRFAVTPLRSSPLDAELPVAEVMTHNPYTAGPLDPIEEAARLLREKKIGCLPVMEGDELVGIITLTNLLDSIIRMTGLEKPSGRLAVSLPDTPGQLARLTSTIAERDVDIRSVLSYYEDEDIEGPTGGKTSRLRVILRLDTLNVHPIARDLRRDGFDVVWPVEKPT